MVASRTQILLIALVLFFVGLSFTLYNMLVLEFPLFPGEYRDVWTIESKIHFSPSEGPVEVSLRLPSEDEGWSILDENFASSGFGFSVEQRDGIRSARWTRQVLEQPTTLYYKAQVFKSAELQLLPEESESVVAPLLEDDQHAAVTRLVDALRDRSSGTESFTALLLKQFLPEKQDQDVEFLLSTYKQDRIAVILDVLAMAGIPGRRVRGIELEDGRRRQLMNTLIEVHNGNNWIVYDPETATPGLPEGFYVWLRGDQSILDVLGGVDSSLEFALVVNNLPARAVIGKSVRADKYSLLDFSIYSLPVEQQGVFKGLLLIPVAALVVVIMRVLIGVRTSGTFMPILIALAFLQTTLVVGLPIFILMVGAGLWIRSYLSHMNLLLVARIAAVVIVVIMLMAVLAVVSYQLGIDYALSVTFFPIIILSWTIERMSILWEEEGGHEVLVQGSGSLLVAVLAYLAMSQRLVAHLTFNFPELLFCLLAIILLLGKYTGYRLSELYRFRDLAEGK